MILEGLPPKVGEGFVALGNFVGLSFSIDSSTLILEGVC